MSILRGVVDSTPPSRGFALESSRPKPSPIMSILSRMASAAARYWYLLFLGILGSGAAAYFGSNYFVKKTWESSSTILYTSLPIGESERGLFIPPDLKTITALVNSPSTLETIRDEFHLDLPVKALDKNLTVLVPNGTKMINLTLKWEDGPTCVAMLNRLTDLFIGRVDDIRRKKLGAHIEDFENSLIAVQKRYAEAAAKLQEIYRREKLVDYKSESVATLVEISQLESTLAEHRREELDTLAKMERMETHLNEVKDQEVREVEVEKQFEATTETVADNRRRQDRIRELIGDERRMQEYRAELEAKSKEIIRTRKLAVRGLISWKTTRRSANYKRNSIGSTRSSFPREPRKNPARRSSNRFSSESWRWSWNSPELVKRSSKFKSMSRAAATTSSVSTVSRVRSSDSPRNSRAPTRSASSLSANSARSATCNR